MLCKAFSDNRLLCLTSCRSEKPSISGIFLKKGPYLKLYSSYIRDFEKITTVFDEACGRFPLFGAAVRDFEVRVKENNRFRSLLRHFHTE